MTSYQTEKECLRILEINKMGQEKEETKERFQGSEMDKYTKFSRWKWVW